ncbi:hypothetical protein BABINDRAFT_15553 [Babjeviella inositovora NRRL Y-12698]|uniref:Uncharacterized protein n=1 Tax=Babjeviella inositovora NRRL Y-12698 TaxID=984486 RepID=A0A1E3QHW3_9ASCO|nr:uncharacterized protein BABINDRAFT_15553 [Babjeviella inositovora NRRL Y-12698]ODQ77303.1 hypothetical protein BABINDRAFT_15553 [Babjeviella inositovora NRRL Y-12698]
MCAANLETTSLDYVHDYTQFQKHDQEIRNLIKLELEEMSKDKDYNVQHQTRLDEVFDQQNLYVSPFSRDIASRNVEVSESFTLGGVDLGRYQEDSERDPVRLQVIITYHQMHQNSLRALDQQLSHASQEILRTAAGTVESSEQSLQSVNAQIEEVNKERYELQTRFKSTHEYLQAQWEKSIKNVVDMGVESSRLEFEQMHLEYMELADGVDSTEPELKKQRVA